jgi:hypothetical protein
VNEPTVLDFVRRHWLAIAAAAFVVWATESAAEGKTVLESLAGPVLVCTWLGAIFLLDRWVLSATDRVAYPSWRRASALLSAP